MLRLIGAVVLWGLSNFFFKLARYHIDSVSTLAYESMAVVIVTALIVFWRNGFVVATNSLGAVWSLCGGASVILGGYLFLEAIGKLKLAIAMPFSALNVLVSALLGVLILGERLGAVHTIGALGMIISAILLSLPEGK